MAPHLHSKGKQGFTQWQHKEAQVGYAHAVASPQQVFILHSQCKAAFCLIAIQERASLNMCAYAVAPLQHMVLWTHAKHQPSCAQPVQPDMCKCLSFFMTTLSCLHTCSCFSAPWPFILLLTCTASARHNAKSLAQRRVFVTAH